MKLLIEETSLAVYYYSRKPYSYYSPRHSNRGAVLSPSHNAGGGLARRRCRRFSPAMVRVNFICLQSVFIFAVSALCFFFVSVAYESWCLVSSVTLKTTGDHVLSSSDSYCWFSGHCVSSHGSSSTSFLISDNPLQPSVSSLLSFSFAGDLVHLTSDHRPKLMSSPLSDSERLESKSSPLDALAKGSGTTTPYSDSHCRLSLTFTSREPSLDVPLCFSEESCASHPVCLAGRPEDSGELNASTSDARCSTLRHLYTTNTTTTYVTSSPSCPPRLYRALAIFWALVCPRIFHSWSFRLKRWPLQRCVSDLILF